MPKYLCVQRRMSEGESVRVSPADLQAYYARWDDWREKFQQNLVDLGGKLGTGRLVTMKGTDGPFVEVKDLVGGYMIVSAENLDEAIEVASECPGLVGPHSGVEVIEIQAP